MNYDLTETEIKKLKGNPLQNPDATLIIKYPDGNYRGFAMKNGALIQVRAGDPNTALNMLITHDGQTH
jgi:hypothetical protein